MISFPSLSVQELRMTRPVPRPPYPRGAQKEPPAIPSLPAAHEVLFFSPKSRTTEP